MMFNGIELYVVVVVVGILFIVFVLLVCQWMDEMLLLYGILQKVRVMVQKVVIDLFCKGLIFIVMIIVELEFVIVKYIDFVVLCVLVCIWYVEFEVIVCRFYKVM